MSARSEKKSAETVTTIDDGEPIAMVGAPPPESVDDGMVTTIDDGEPIAMVGAPPPGSVDDAMVDAPYERPLIEPQPVSKVPNQRLAIFISAIVGAVAGLVIRISHEYSAGSGAQLAYWLSHHQGDVTIPLPQPVPQPSTESVGRQTVSAWSPDQLPPELRGATPVPIGASPPPAAISSKKNNVSQDQIDHAQALDQIRRSLAASNTLEIPLLQHDKMFTVPVMINDTIALNFLIDSGATDVSIRRRRSHSYACRNYSADELLGNQTYKLADGSTYPSQIFKIRTLKWDVWNWRTSLRVLHL